MGYLVRTAEQNDAAELGRVHVLAWQQAYRGGLLPNDYLDTMSVDERAGMWGGVLSQSSEPRIARLVAETQAGDIVGFAMAGPRRGGGTREGGELYAINVDPTHWGKGVGALLLATAVDAMGDADFPDAILWVHPRNVRARTFYETHGWVCDEIEREEDVLGVTVPEVRYSLHLRS